MELALCPMVIMALQGELVSTKAIARPLKTHETLFTDAGHRIP